MILPTSSPRAGLTLLEVIVAMAIFLMSLVAIHQLVAIGNDRALEVKWQSRTSLRCQSKLNEILVGAEPISGSGGYSPFSDDPDLQWKMEATPSDSAGLLYTVKVSVQVDPAKTTRPIETQLVQMILNPINRGSTMDQPLATPPGTPTTDSSTTPSASTTPASGGAAAAAGGKAGATGKGGGGGKGGAAGGGAGGAAAGKGGNAATTGGAGNTKGGTTITPGGTPAAPAAGGTNRGGGGGNGGGGNGGGGNGGGGNGGGGNGGGGRGGN